MKDLSASSPPPTTKSVLFFWADWHDESSPNGSTDLLFRTLASSSTLPFYRVEAEAVPDLSNKYDVTVVPSFVLLDHDGSMVDRIEGVDDVSRLTQAVVALQNRSTGAEESKESSSSSTGGGQQQQQQQQQESEDAMTEEERLHRKLKNLISSSQVMLFMKGSPREPKCGFSRQTTELLSQSNIPFGSFDILSDDSVRQGLKTYSDWPTFPQLYVKGELIGGLDILKEMAEEDGGLAEQLEVDVVGADAYAGAGAGKEEPLEERLKKLVKKHKVMLFMKGLPSAPKCGFSRQICDILNGGSISYDSFNILEDEEVRQGLKKFSDWPTFPQLYVNGDLVGGLDIVKEMVDDGDFDDLLNDT